MPTATQNISQAISAYSNTVRNSSAIDGRTQSPGTGNIQGDFGGLVQDAIVEARKISERSEKLSIAAINDRADITQVVTAVAEAEMTLNTMVNVRDRVITAYNEIIRMPI